MIKSLKISKKSIFIAALPLVMILFFASAALAQFYNGSEMSFGKKPDPVQGIPLDLL